MIRLYHSEKATLCAIMLFSLFNAAATIIVLNDKNRIPPVVLLNMILFSIYTVFYMGVKYVLRWLKEHHEDHR